MMKKIKYILLVFSLSLLASSCTDYLNIKPENQMLLEDYWKKESEVEATVLACYRAMQEKDFMWRVMLWGELRSDNVITNVSARDEEKQINDVNILATNSDCTWGSFYTVINYCNTVLKYAPGVMAKDPNFTTADLQAKEAEVYAIRALSYFYLVRTFRDVPLVLDATVSDNQDLLLYQSSPDKVLDQITTDLLKAESWALSVYPTEKETKGRMTKDAIRAILADVYLWRKEYAKCIEYCDKLINATTFETNFSGAKTEVPKYKMIEEFLSSDIFYRGNSTESIFELQFSSDVENIALSNNEDDKQLHHGLYGTSTQIGQVTAPTLNVESDMIFSSTDNRKTDFIVTKKTETGAYQILKYIGMPVYSGNKVNSLFKLTTSNWIFYRITDIMLMKAEALVQMGTESDLKSALHIVNTTYMRANPTLLETDTLVFDKYKSVFAMDKLVLLERQRELMFEGKRWFDLVRHSERNNSTSDLVDYVIKKYNSNQSTITSKLSVMNALYLPIHADELKVNPLLKQNPYYQLSSNIKK